MELYIAYFLFLLIGLTLGLIGGGGSILGVPVLVYLFHLPADIATGYSLFIVGLTSLIGAFSFIRKGEINIEALWQFGIPSLFSVFCVRKYVIPVLPEVFFNAGEFVATKQVVIMCLFAVLIAFSSISMIKRQKPNKRLDIMWDEFSKSPIRLPFVVLLGVLTGLITGFIGAGGGFIIIPVLLFFIRVPMKKAVGTSLSIIAVNSLVGFTGNLSHTVVDWPFLLIVSTICIAGILIGNVVVARVQASKLKAGFGWFTLFVGIFVIVKELFIK